MHTGAGLVQQTVQSLVEEVPALAPTATRLGLQAAHGGTTLRASAHMPPFSTAGAGSAQRGRLGGSGRPGAAAGRPSVLQQNDPDVEGFVELSEEGLVANIDRIDVTSPMQQQRAHHGGGGDVTRRGNDDWENLQ